ncbi:MAG: septum site-determining protein MinC [Clostridiales bacterium]|nr:septum site-determining protein MinC [Clostridiales bacterium]
MREQELPESGGQTMLIQRTLRSGQNINFDGNVVVLGDVNHGAEVVASGHVLVMGALRGVVHAGAGGFEGATITALELAPTQLRICSHITRSPDGEGSGENPAMPETARIKDGAVTIEKYQPPR